MKTWQVHAEFIQAPGHLASFYGFKTKEDTEEIVDYLTHNIHVTSLWYESIEKGSGKRGRWKREKFSIRAEGRWKP